MVGDFLDRLRRIFAQEAVGRPGQPMQQHVLPGRKQQVPGNGLREIAVRLFDEHAIAKVEHVAMKGQTVAVPGLIQQQRRLTNQVQGQVCEADVDFQRWPVPTPFAKPLAKHQRIVAEPQQIVLMRGMPLRRRRRIERARAGRFTRHVDRRQGRHQMCFTSSGMS